MPSAAFTSLRLPPPATAGRRVLVVDDDPATRELFRAVLHRANFRVHVADSGRTALRLVADWKPDVVTLDLAMPIVDGFAVIDWFRALPSPPPIVVVSGGTYPEEMLSFGRPVVAFLPKPLHPDDLVAACDRALCRPQVPGRQSASRDID
jgi:CheY-like chemotaxis protein